MPSCAPRPLLNAAAGGSHAHLAETEEAVAERELRRAHARAAQAARSARDDDTRACVRVCGMRRVRSCVWRDTRAHARPRTSIGRCTPRTTVCRSDSVARGSAARPPAAAAAAAPAVTQLRPQLRPRPPHHSARQPHRRSARAAPVEGARRAYARRRGARQRAHEERERGETSSGDAQDAPWLPDPIAAPLRPTAQRRRVAACTRASGARARTGAAAVRIDGTCRQDEDRRVAPGVTLECREKSCGGRRTHVAGRCTRLS
jgi:hypothetical protein